MKKLACLVLLALSWNAVASNLGDYAPATNICGKFTTYQPSTGAAFALAGTPALSIYKDNSTTQSTTGVTLTASFDSVTGLNHFCVDTSADGSFYSAGSNFDVVITTGTVDSVSVVGSVVGTFTIRKGTVTGIPNATAGASGGLLIAGTNADFDVTANASFAGGITVTQSTSNASALVVTGNGTGNGATITSGSGATGNGVSLVAASTNGNGLAATGTGTGSGVIGTGGATGDGLEGVGGSTSGAGLRAAGTAGNSPAATLVGQGSAAGLLTTGGATGHGIAAVGGVTSGSGISAVASTSGSGIVATGVGTTQPGIAATGGSTSSAGISATGGGTGSGILATSGAGATGNGITATAASTNGHGLSVSGVGTGSGVLGTGGATGHGLRLVGGSTSGNGISTAFTAPSAGAPELGFDDVGTLSGTHSSTTADLGTNAPGTVSDIVGHTLRFPTRKLSRTVTAYDTSTGVATFAAIDADITLTNGDPWLLFGTAPGSAGGGATAEEVWTYNSGGGRTLTAFDEDNMTIDINSTPTGAVASVTGNVGGNVTGSVGSVASGGITATSIGSDAFTAAKFASDVGTEFANATWALDATGQQTQGTFGQAIGDPAADTDSIWSLANTNLNATVSSRASQTSLDAVDDFVDTEITDIRNRLPAALVSGRMDSSVGAMAGDVLTAAATASDFGTEVGTATWATTTRVLTAGTNIALAKGTGVTGFNDLSAAQVNAEVDTALTDIHLDHLLAADYDPASKPGVATALLNELVESDGGISRFTANALEQAPTGTGESLAAIADAVWDEALSGHATGGSAGAALSSASSAGDPWATSLPGAYGSGTAGNIIGNRLDAAVSSRASQTSVDTVDDFLDTEIADVRARLPAALVGGRMDSSTGAMANNVMTAAAAAADLTTEVQSGLATSSALGALDTKVGTPSNLGSGATLAANNADIEDQTDDIGLAGAGLTAVDDAVLAAIAALNNLSLTQIRDMIIEDQGGGITLGCALAAKLAVLAGDVTTTGGNSTFEDPSGTETRVTSVVISNGNRTATITCPTY